ncbi:MAG TPA: hypothetical protein VHB46_15225 [Burkholderiales bacterium]|nr:hypothetical protein [Burkholderiales bacterium]
MLQEIRAIRQDDAQRVRHWFQDDFFDLFTWTNPSGDVVAFQLCYDRLRHERVLAWTDATGFQHRRIDDGEALPGPKMSPLMVADGAFPSDRVAEEFAQRSMQIDDRWRRFILAKIDEAAVRFLADSNPG